MIQPQELRKGNKIIANGLHGGRIMTVDRLADKGTLSEENRPVMFGEHEVGEFLKDCEGVPLSPDILQACGFESVRPTMMPGYAFYRSKSFDGRHRFRWESVEGFAMETVGSGWLWHFKDIKYLHQIQNFAYWITGTELTINLENVKV